MKKITILVLVFIVLMYTASLSGCSAIDQRLKDGTAVASGQSVDSPFGKDSGGGDDDTAQEPTFTATLTPPEGAGGGDDLVSTPDVFAIGTSVRATVNAQATLTVAAMGEAIGTNGVDTTQVGDDDEENATPTLSGTQFESLYQTLTAIVNLTNTPQPSATATATQQPTTGTGTATLTPTITTTPAGTPTETPVPCTAFRFVAHVSYPLYSTVQPSTSFYKSWQIQNTGYCTWTGDYALVYEGGFQMGGTSPLVLGSGVVVYPGQYVTITIQLFTPPQPGTYDSQWVMQDSNGVTFSGEDGFPLEAIVVVPGVPAPVFTAPASTAPPFYTSTPSP